MADERHQFRNLFFVHVPKTGGRWLDTTLSNYVEKTDSFFSPIESFMQLGLPSGDLLESLHNRYGWHMALHECQLAGYGDFSDFLTVSVCRNPFDMLVSMYHHHSMDGVSQRYSKRKGPSGWGSANISHGVNSFSEFIKKFCDPSVPWVHGNLRRFLFHQMYLADGTCGVDVCLRYEMLNRATAELLSRIHENNLKNGIKSEFSEADYNSILNAERINVSQKRRKKDYRAYYTDELRELVEHACAAELRLFNYDFDGIVSDNAEGPSPIVIPTSTFHSLAYPVALAGFSAEEQSKYSYILQRAHDGLGVQVSDMTSLVDVIVNVSGHPGLPKKSAIWAHTHWRSPNAEVDALVAMGYTVFCDSEDVYRFMLKGKVHGEWLPLPEYREKYYKDRMGLPLPKRQLVEVASERAHRLSKSGEYFNPQAADENMARYKAISEEYEDLKRTHELNARLRDMGVNPEELETIQPKE